MYNAEIEAHLNNVFAEGAKRQAEYYKGKVWSYNIDDSLILHSNGLKASGKCIVLDVSYSRVEDCNIYSIRDINTNEEYTVNEFIIKLKEEV